MNYFKYIPFDVVNGPGIRCTLFVSGCSIHCPDCFNKATWAYDAGYPFTDIEENHIIRDLQDTKVNRKGFSILGGEPLDPRNVEAVNKLLKNIRSNTTKDIWLWTGYEYENVPLTEHIFYILEHVDVIVDGPFIAKKKDLTLPYRGSSNQRIIDAKQSTFCNIVELDVE